MSPNVLTTPGVAEAVLQTPLPLIHSVSDPFPPNLQNPVFPKPKELEKCLDFLALSRSKPTWIRSAFKIIGKSNYWGKKGRNVFVAPYCDRM